MTEHEVVDDLRAQTTARRVISGSLWSALGSGLAPLMLLTQSVVAARFLGPTRMGQQSFIAWVELTSSVAVSAGCMQMLNRYLGASLAAGRGPQVRRVLDVVTRIQLVGALVPGVILAAVVAPSADAALRPAWVLAGVGATLLTAQAVPSTVLGALQEWRKQAVISMVIGAAATVATVVVLAAGGGITGMFAVEAAAFAASGLWSASRARPVIARLLPHAAPAGSLGREAARYAVIAVAQTTLAYVVWQRSEFFFLDRYSAAREIALYSIAFATVSGLQRLPEALTQTLTPSLAVLVGADERARVAVAAARAMRLLWLLATPMTAGAMAVGPLALRLIYGADYRGSGPVIVILVAALPVVLVARVAASVLHADGLVRIVLGCLATGVAVDIALCLVLVPRHGAVGAAVANLCAQVVAAAVEVVYVRRVIGALHVPWVRLSAATLAAAGCGGAAWAVAAAVPTWPGLVAALAAGAAGYLALGVPLRPIEGEDLRWMESVVGSRDGGRLTRLLHLLGTRSDPPPRQVDTPNG